MTTIPAERAVLSEKASEIIKDMTKCEGIACVVARTVKRDSWLLIEIICPIKESLHFKTLLENGFLATAKLTEIGAHGPVICVSNIEEGTSVSSVVSEVLIDNTSNEIVGAVHTRNGSDLEFKFENSEIAYIDKHYFK